jgi:hypothetical protein
MKRERERGSEQPAEHFLAFFNYDVEGWNLRGLLDLTTFVVFYLLRECHRELLEVKIS